jgi:hypothetical protein
MMAQPRQSATDSTSAHLVALVAGYLSTIGSAPG